MVEELQGLAADLLGHLVVRAGLRQRIDSQDDLSGVAVLRVAHEEPRVLHSKWQHCAISGLLALTGDSAIALNLHVGGGKGAQAHLYLGVVATQANRTCRGLHWNGTLELVLGHRKWAAIIGAYEVRAIALDRDGLRKHARLLRNAAANPLHQVQNSQGDQQREHNRKDEGQTERGLVQWRAHGALQRQR